MKLNHLQSKYRYYEKDLILNKINIFNVWKNDLMLNILRLVFFFFFLTILLH